MQIRCNNIDGNQKFAEMCDLQEKFDLKFCIKSTSGVTTARAAWPKPGARMPKKPLNGARRYIYIGHI